MNTVILWIVAAGIVIGGLDRIFGSRLGLGEKFDDGMKAMGPLALSMTGILCLAPLISAFIKSTLSPLCLALHMDPAVFGAFLANDMGGYPLAMELSLSEESGLLSGLITASMFGATLVFSIPVGLSIIPADRRDDFAQGLILGFITIPVGTAVGGLTAGFSLSVILQNTLPVLVFSVLLALGLRFFPRGMLRGCTVFGKIITAAAYIGLIIGAFQSVTGVTVLPGLAPVEDGLAAVTQIALILLGTFPAVSLLCRALNRPLARLADKTGMDTPGMAGLLFTMANSIPVFATMKDMTQRSMIINTAWIVTVTCALGDHLGFTAGVRPDMITPVIAGKLAAGIASVLLAWKVTGKTAAKPAA